LALGVKGHEVELRTTSDEFSGHCLALTLLGSYLTDAYNGGVGIASGYLSQALMRDCMPSVDSASYRWHHLQKFGRGLKAPPEIFLEERLNENNDRLRDTFELVER
jgi:hypothetical protein